MRVLAVDSSARRRLVVAVAGEGGALVDGRVVSEAALDTALPELLRELLRPAPDAVVAVTGPGSYTGVRAGMAAALGVAQALAVPLHGAGALQVVAFAAPEAVDEVLAVAGAGRGGVHVARHRRDGGGWTPREPARRESLAGLRLPEGTVAVTLDDPPPIETAVRGDHLRALAAAAWAALAGPELASSGLRAEYADAGGTPPISRV
jgi:tRNA threonylcarbamoyladenosine biosynthesis protein TsaB